jgi:hypothetical protein
MNSIATPTRLETTSRDCLRELRKALSQHWRYLRPGSRRRELCRGIINQIDARLRGEAAR